MHQKPADKLLAGNRYLFPLPLIFIVFGSKCNRRIRHTFDAVIADGNPVRVPAKVLNNRLRAMERLLTVRNPFFLVTGIQ